MKHELNLCPVWGTLAHVTILSNDSWAVNSPRAGGKYTIPGTRVVVVGNLNENLKVRITSWMISQRLLGNEVPDYTENLDIESLPDLSPREQADKLLQYINSKVSKISDDFEAPLIVPNTNQQEWWIRYAEMLAWSSSTELKELHYLLNYLEERGYIFRPSFSSGKSSAHLLYNLTMDGQINIKDSETSAYDINKTSKHLGKMDFIDAINGMNEPSPEHLPDTKKKYDVALSFASEQRGFVEDVAKFLVESGVTVFYDKSEKNSLWGKSLLEEIKNVYAEESFYVVLFISQQYCSKTWPKLEANHSIMAAMIEKKTTILPIRFDQSVLPSLPEDVAYIEIEDYSTPALIAKEICDKIGIRPLGGKLSNAPPPHKNDSMGQVSFNYSNYNGKYIIGSDKTQFETKWSKAGGTSIHLYNDPPSIMGIAVVPRKIKSISQIENAENLNYTSRVREVYINQIAVLKNVNGFYAAIRIIEIKRDTQGDENNEINFEYVIQKNGSDNFSQFNI